VQARSVFQRLQLEFTADSLLTLLHFFHGTITSASTVIVLGEEGRTEAGRAKVEAVAALGYVAVATGPAAISIFSCKNLDPRSRVYLTSVDVWAVISYYKYTKELYYVRTTSRDMSFF